jgi:hypothetical protein
MLNTSRLFVVLAAASIMTAATEFGLALGLASILEKPNVPQGVQGAGVAITVLIPIGTASWWIFRRLRGRDTRAEAIAVATTFAVVAPISLVAGMLFAPIPGGYAAFLGRPFGLVGAFVFIATMVTSVSFVPSLLAVWVARRIGRSHQAQ